MLRWFKRVLFGQGIYVNVIEQVKSNCICNCGTDYAGDVAQMVERLLSI